MKKIKEFTIYTVVISTMLLCTASCKKEEQPDLWNNATYKEDTEFGVGGKTIKVEVEAKEKAVTFTINTDKDTLGDALLEYDLVSGEEGAYGLYIKEVNGIRADYDEDQSYWALNKDGETMLTGADGAEISSGEHYELIYTKQ